MLGLWGWFCLRVLWPVQEAIGKVTDWLGYTELVDEES